MAVSQAESGRRVPVRGIASLRWLGSHPIFQELHRRPSLLAWELAWRWSAGALLLLLGAFAGWRVWRAVLPSVQATGLLLLTPDSLLADPLRLAGALLQSFQILAPPLMRAALGLAPFGVFLWVCAFALGRAGVLAYFDPLLPRRRWLLAESEALRIAVLFGCAAAWFSMVRFAAELAFRGEEGHGVLFLLFFAVLTWSFSWFVGRFRRALAIATAVSLVRGTVFSRALRRAWRLDEHHKIVPLRKAVSRVRLYLLLAGLVLAFVPAPFALGWPLLAWWFLLSLPPLAAADAWRLGALFALIRSLQDVDQDANKDARPGVEPTRGDQAVH